MPKRAHSRIKPSYTWCRTAAIQANVLASPSNGTIPRLCASSTIPEANNDVLLERIIASVTLRRISTGDATQQISYMIALQKVDAGGVLGEILDPLSSNQFDLGNRNILAWGQLPLQGVQRTFDGAAISLTVDRSTSVTNIDVKVRRRLHRLNNAITFTIVGDSANDFEFRLQSSVLLRLN